MTKRAAPGESEEAVQQRIRLRAAELGIPLERNNVGACKDDTGRLIRYGLANDSAQKSRRIKSGDLIGLLPLVLYPHANGAGYSIGSRRGIPGEASLIGVFLSVECKAAAWHADPARFNDRERAQQTWIDHVRKYGGVAGFCRSVEEFEDLIRKAGFNA